MRVGCCWGSAVGLWERGGRLGDSGGHSGDGACLLPLLVVVVGGVGGGGWGLLFIHAALGLVA